jgi:23S rRNA pseudouridine2457 synthase
MLIAFHKPYGVLSQFTSDGSSYASLSAFNFPPRVYPIGRLDADSEGLLLLSDEARWNNRLLHPKHRHPRTYLAEVERIPISSSIDKLRQGLRIQDYQTRPCQARLIDAPPAYIQERNPPIRFRKTVPTAWMELTLEEGKNRQVRRMLAAIGHPCLRLIRVKIGDFSLASVGQGQWVILDDASIDRVLASSHTH